MRRHKLIRRANLKFRAHRKRKRVRRRNPHQEFHYLWYVWDIDRAQQHIAKRRKRNKDIEEVDVEHIYSRINWSTPERPTLAGTTVDPTYALTKTDVTKPLIFGLLKDKGTWFTVLIDGHHRLYRAHAEGLKTMPAYFLNKRENYHSMVGPRKAPLKRKRQQR